MSIMKNVGQQKSGRFFKLINLTTLFFEIIWQNESTTN